MQVAPLNIESCLLMALLYGTFWISLLKFLYIIYVELKIFPTIFVGFFTKKSGFIVYKPTLLGEEIEKSR